MEAHSWLRETIPPIIVVLLLDLAVTAVLIVMSGKTSRIGTLRPANSIPPKILELVLVGLAVGLLAAVASGGPDATLISLGVAFVAMIDLDHLPSAIGVAQPIRPAHTLAFLALEATVLFVAFSKRPEVALMAVAAFFGHMAGDTGVFAPLSPFSFHYVSLSAFDVPFALTAGVFAIGAGYARRRRRKAMPSLFPA